MVNNITRNPPKNLNKSGEYLFKHELVKPGINHFYNKFKFAWINGQGDIISIIPPRVYSRKKLSFRGKLSVFVKLLRSPRMKITGSTTYLAGFDSWSGGYFHWMLDFIPKLAYSKSLGRFTTLLPKSFGSGIFKDSLKPFGTQVQLIDEDKFWYVRNLIRVDQTGTSGNYNPTLIKKVRSIYTGHFKKERNTPFRKVYISRSAATRRKIINENEILPVLQRYGFETVFCENLSFEDQVSLLTETKHLISNHGAGLSNMLFMPSGSSVLEIRKSDDTLNNCYFSLASALDLPYYYLLAPSSESEESSHTANLKVDSVALETIIKELLSHES